MTDDPYSLPRTPPRPLTDELQQAVTLLTAAFNYGNSGKFEEAVGRQRQAIEIFEKVYEPNDLDLANYYAEMAMYCRHIEELRESMEFESKALEIYLHHVGVDHPIVAIKYLNLAAGYFMQEDLAMARIHIDKAVAIFGATVQDSDLNYVAARQWQDHIASMESPGA